MSDVALLSNGGSFASVNETLVNSGDYDLEFCRLDYKHQLEDIKSIVNTLKSQLKDQDISSQRRIIMITISISTFTAYYNQPLYITTPIVTNQRLKQTCPFTDINDKKVIVVLRVLSIGRSSTKIAATTRINVPKSNYMRNSYHIDYNKLKEEGTRIHITKDNIGISNIKPPLLKLYSPDARYGESVTYIE